MSLTIISAVFANPDHTAAVAQTAEAGAVLLSAVDTPAEWAAMLAACTPSAFVSPAVSSPSMPTKAELMAQLAAIQAQIEALPD